MLHGTNGRARRYACERADNFGATSASQRQNQCCRLSAASRTKRRAVRRAAPCGHAASFIEPRCSVRASDRLRPVAIFKLQWWGFGGGPHGTPQRDKTPGSCGKREAFPESEGSGAASRKRWALAVFASGDPLDVHSSRRKSKLRESSMCQRMSCSSSSDKRVFWMWPSLLETASTTSPTRALSTL